MQRKLLKVVVKEAEEISDRYGRPRRTEIADVGLAEVQAPEDLIPDQKGMIVFSEGGYIKRICDSTFATQVRRGETVAMRGARLWADEPTRGGVQRRGGTGKKGSKLKDDDAVRLVMTTMSHDHLVFIATNGACFSMRAYNVPERSRVSQGAPVAELLPNLQAGVGIATIVPLREHADDRSLVLITRAGKIKRLQLSALPCAPSAHPTRFVHAACRHTHPSLCICRECGMTLGVDQTVRGCRRLRQGTPVMTMKEGDSICYAATCSEEDAIVVACTAGKVVAFDAGLVREASRHTAGVIAKKLGKGARPLLCCKVLADVSRAAPRPGSRCSILCEHARCGTRSAA